MNSDFSDLITITRDAMQCRSRLGLFLMPHEVRNLVRRLNTFVALAAELEDELHMRELREHRDYAQRGSVILNFTAATLVVDRQEETGSTP